MSKKYESPKIKFESLHLEESIAATCWGHHGTDTVLYYNTSGAGYVSFTVKGADACKLDHVNDITIVEHINTNVTQQEVYDQLIKAGGANGNPWKNSNYSEIPPDNWS